VNVATFEKHRVALTGHCYRMLGSGAEAEDAVQETIVRAWKSMDTFQERAAVSTWLHRIATNVCLDALADRSRRARPMAEGPVGTPEDQLEQRERTHWLEPVPDARVIPADADPSEQLMLRQSIRLAFVAALQTLPPKQRAALLLTEVMGWSAADVASTLDTTVTSINSALQRARATLGARHEEPGALTEAQSELVDRYVAAFLRYDVDELVSMLRDDATLSMPPFSLWLQGHASIARWLAGPGAGCRGSRLVPTAACGLPAFAQYRPDGAGGFKAWAIIVLELAGEQIVGMNSFLDVETLFPMFGLDLVA